MDDGPERVRQNSLERRATLLHRRDDAAKAGLGQHDAGGGFRYIGRGEDGDAHLGLPQCRRVIGAVAAHADHMAAALKCLDERVLVLGQYAGEDAKIFGADIVGQRRGRADRPA